MDKKLDHPVERALSEGKYSVKTDDIRRVRNAALLSRLLLFIIQVVSNNVIPDHQPDVFNPPPEKVSDVGLWDTVVERLLGGFRRWDAIYFLFIAKHGYPYENTLAFFPLYPIMVNQTAGLTQYLPVSLTFDHWLLLCGSLLNLFFVVKAAEALYEWIHLVSNGRYRAVAFGGAVAFAFNPASIFFSACYSEALFCYLTFKAFALLEKKPDCLKNQFFVVCLIALSAATRSNGLVSLGVFGLKQIDELWRLCAEGVVNQPIKQRPTVPDHIRSPHARKPIDRSIDGPITLHQDWRRTKLVFLTGLLGFLGVVPFLLFQLYGHHLFCRPYVGESLPKYLIHYARERSYTYLHSSRSFSGWCEYFVPFAYSHVQKSHWNVGFLQYYEPKQIPNFLLALPIVILSVWSLWVLFRKSDPKSRCNLAPYGIHLLVLLISCVFFVHIQVTTRMICSSSPLIYLAVGQVLADLSPGVNFWSYIKHIFQRSKIQSQKLIAGYFLGYFVVGTALHCNFLPWT